MQVGKLRSQPGLARVCLPQSSLLWLAEGQHLEKHWLGGPQTRVLPVMPRQTVPVLSPPSPTPSLGATSSACLLCPQMRALPRHLPPLHGHGSCHLSTSQSPSIHSHNHIKALPWHLSFRNALDQPRPRSYLSALPQCRSVSSAVCNTHPLLSPPRLIP